MSRPARIRNPNKLAPKEVEHLLGVHRATLMRWRREKQGPPYYREVSRIYYYRDELDAWKESTKWG